MDPAKNAIRVMTRAAYRCSGSGRSLCIQMHAFGLEIRYLAQHYATTF